MHRFIPFVLIAVVAASCGAPPQPTEDQKFESYARNYVEALLTISPEWATMLGDHRFDDRLSDYSRAGVEANRALSLAYLDSLGTLDPAKLSAVNAIDWKIMRNALQSTVFSIDTLREYEWNPTIYNPGNAIYGLLAREFAPLPERLRSLGGRLRQVPSVVAAAKENLGTPPKVFTETAINQVKGTVGLIRSELDTFLKDAPGMTAELAPAREAAAAALEEYVAWMEKDLLPRSTGDFRIGEEKYRRKLYYTLESALSKEEILTRAEHDLQETQAVMEATARPMFAAMFPGRKEPADRKTLIKSVLDKLAESRPDNATIVPRAEEYLKECNDFVAAKGLMTLPTEPVKIIVMPEFQRGVAVAYCDAAGPLEKNGETFYAISPTPKDWAPERVTSFFREYNDHMLRNLTVHEAVPGHYLQLMHANRFKAPTMVRALFGSGTFVEGWATYAEQVMVEHGYGGDGVKMQQLKMRLRLIINAIIDQKIHTAGMTEQEAMDLMMKEGFQEDGEAAGKWRRACLSSTQLSTYYVGNAEINDLRKGYEAKNGKQTSLKAMHDSMLSFGSPAPKYVKEMLGL